MATNLLKKYNQVLELLYRNDYENIVSIKNVFYRDFNTEKPLVFNAKIIQPTPADGEDKIERLFNHLTRKELDYATKKREFDSERAIRIHWIKHHFLNYKMLNHIISFIVPDENRVYLLDKNENYVIVLEPLRKIEAYYLLTAYKLLPSNYQKIMKKLEKRGNII
jgi:hypothetical protein